MTEFKDRINVEALADIAEWLEAGAPHKNGVHGFSMAEGIAGAEYECNTICCIAGAAVAFNMPEWREFAMEHTMFYEDHNSHVVWDVVKSAATAILGLNEAEAHELFTPDGYMETTTDPALAARTIRKFIETGEVEWE